MTESKIHTLENLQKQVENWQSEGDKIVFTNGCFDIVHLGHIDYLEKARNLGNKLVLGLNTDDSVKRLKGLLDGLLSIRHLKNPPLFIFYSVLIWAMYWAIDRKSTRLNSSHRNTSRMPSSA